jgi:pilus assembly protein FimV
MMQKRNRWSLLAAPLLMLIVMMALTLRVEALTVGDLTLRNTPGETLRALIPITLEPDESMAALRVTLASDDGYAQQQLQKPAFLQDLQIALLAKGESRGQIQLFGKQPWQGEEAVLLLQLQWPEGEMSRRFQIASVSDEAAETTPLYVEVGENESLDSIALRLSKHSNRSYRHMMVALYRANPDAFYRDNLNNLKSGVRLRVPTNKELYQLTDAEVTATLREHKARWQAANDKVLKQQEEKQQIEQRLERVQQESAEMAQRNRELKERLARLEQQMNSVSHQVLAYQAKPDESESAATPQTSRSESIPVAEESVSSPKAKKPPAVDEGLPTVWMLLLMAAVAGIVVAIWRFAPRAGKEE